MTKRVLASLAVTLGVLALGAVPSSGLGIAGGVDIAKAQAPADPDAGLDDTAAGGLDTTDVDAPVDVAPTDPGATPTDPGATPTDPGATPTDPGATPPAAPADPDAGLDDTPVGGLDQTDLGTPVDQTDTTAPLTPGPPAGPPATATPPTGTPTTPAAPTPTAAPPVYVTINLPATGNGQDKASKPKGKKRHNKKTKHRRKRHHKRHNHRGRH